MSCSNSSDTRKLVRLSNSTPSITQGSSTLAEFSEASFKNFFQEVTNYYMDSISLGTGGATALVNRESDFIFIKATWPTTALESEKKLNLQLSDFDIVGGTGATALGATALSAEKIPFKDFFIINSTESHEHVQVTNNSTKKVTLNIITAK